MSLQRLGDEVHVAPSHLFHIENGDKVPSEALAVDLARALGEDLELYRAWARARSRSDVYTAVDSAQVVARFLRGARAGVDSEAVARGWVAPQDSSGQDTASIVSVPSLSGETAGPRPARLLVPVLPEGEDPGSEGRPRGAIGMLRLDPGMLGSIEPLERPFAYPLSPQGTRRIEGLLPPRGLVIITRRLLPLPAGAICAVRDGRVVLARALWNGQQLLLLPAPPSSDFQTFPAATPAELERHVVGRVAAVRAET